MSLMAAIRKKGKTGTGLKPVDRSKSKTEDTTSSGDSEAHQPNLLASIQQTKARLKNGKEKESTEAASKAPEKSAATPKRRGSRRGSIKKQFVTTPDIVAKRPENQNNKATTTTSSVVTKIAPAVPPPAGAPSRPPAAPTFKPNALSAASLARLGGGASGGPEVRIARNVSTASD